MRPATADQETAALSAGLSHQNVSNYNASLDHGDLCDTRIERLARAISSQSRIYATQWERSAWQLTTTVALFAMTLVFIYALSVVSPWLAAPFVVPAAGLLVRLFIIQHDCGHGSFFKSRRANDVLGRALAVLTLTPYEAWKADHAAHHASSGDLDRRGRGDVMMLTVAEYDALAPFRRLGYRLYRNPLIMVLLGAPINFILLQRFVVGQSSWDGRAWRSILALDLVLVLAFGVPIWMVGFAPVLETYLPVMIVASWIGNWLFYVQHQFDGAYWERADGWSFKAAALQGGSYFKLPPVLRWFSGSIGLHHVHHLCSRIPNYHLQACLDRNPELQSITRTISLRDSLACWQLALWDERNSKLVSFSSAS